MPMAAARHAFHLAECIGRFDRHLRLDESVLEASSGRSNKRAMILDPSDDFPVARGGRANRLDFNALAR